MKHLNDGGNEEVEEGEKNYVKTNRDDLKLQRVINSIDIATLNALYVLVGVERSGIMFKDFNTHLSMLIAHKLRIEAVQRRTSNDIQISHKIHPNGHEPKNNKSNIMFQQALNWIEFQEKHYKKK